MGYGNHAPTRAQTDDVNVFEGDVEMNLIVTELVPPFFNSHSLGFVHGSIDTLDTFALPLSPTYLI